jgi:hypothetical protein
MRSKALLFSLGVLTFFYIISMIAPGCAQIGAPTGGPKDTLPPRLLSATPRINSTNFTGNKITLNFNEYVEVRDALSNVQVSPFQKTNPVIDYKLRTVTVKLKDTLLANTTYSINFGNAIIDNNEGNVLKNFTYVFSTGKYIDSLELSGKLTIAETGKVDSNLLVLLYRNAPDSAVQTKKPDYMTRPDGKGEFTFHNLPPGIFKVYALKDGDGSKTYNSKSEQFAFTDPVTVSSNTQPVSLYAYAEQKDTKPKFVTPPKPAADKKLRYSASAGQQNQDLQSPLELSFNRPLKKLDVTKIILTDTNYKPIGSVIPTLDSTNKKIILAAKWIADTKYRLIINSAAVTDSADIGLAKSDTLRFITKKETDYGKLVLRFTGLDLSRHPVLQFVQDDIVKESSPLTANEWSKKLFNPGEYELRILFDDNKNGKWDPGNYSKKLQPEKVISLSQKLGIRADWDNERDIKL